MVFSSSIFLFGFLPLLLGLYFLVDGKLRNYILLLFSLIFYGFGGPKLLLLMIIIVFVDYIAALMISKKRFSKYKRILFILTIIVNVGTLFYFKYMGLTVDIINRLLSFNIPVPNIVLPIGISFYTFQSLSYVIDVYRKDAKVQKNFFDLLLYVSMFPQLVAGPIVRYTTVAKEIKKRKITLDDFCSGLERFIFGLAKKLIIANNVGHLADTIFASSNFTTIVGWLAVVAYTLQIYFDFSAYSDMAIGLGKIFGFNFEENFNYPYISKTITEFWRRWHISLSTWFRDYIYIPLGGNRKGRKRQIFNLFVVWSLTGIWHGAAINFLLWGLYYFIFLMLEKFVLKKYLDKLPGFLTHIYSLFIIMIGWVLFRAEGLDGCINILKTLFIPSWDKMTTYYLFMYIEKYGIYLLLGCILSVPVFPKIREYLLEKKYKNNLFVNGLYYIFVFGVFVLCIIYLSKSSYNPFIYFRF